MPRKIRFRNLIIIPYTIILIYLISACNLTSAPEQQLQLTEFPTSTLLPTRTGIPTGGVPTTLPMSTALIPTRQGVQLPPTSVVLPQVSFYPTSTPLPISIVILSPIPGNVVAGNVQILGAAIHPQFLQYQLEYGPDPNPGNLWFPATGIVQTPVLNGLLGIWPTAGIQDSTYQLRLRVTLRDGSNLATVVNNIRIQNQAPTPVPSSTPTTPRPIAAFNQDRASGQAPLVVRFTNQSSGSITSYSWTFGDGGSSSDPNPTYTFRNPGLLNVTLTVNGPGGSSNVSRQINVQSATTPVAGFTQDKTTGPSPLTVTFTNQSTGNITSYNWTFGDGNTSTEQNPTHQFTDVGTYNVILTVTGPGGSSSVTRKITVEDPVIPAPDAAFASDKSSGNAPLTVQFVNQTTGQTSGYVWDFGDQQTSSEQNPVHTFSSSGTYTVTLTAIGPGGQDTAEATITVDQVPNAPSAAFSADKASGNTPLVIQFTNHSTGDISSYVWDFGDGTTSTDQSPSHTYTASSTYTVRLTVTGPGGSDEETTTITATQPLSPPDAAFTQDQLSGIAPLTVQFTNQSTGEGLSYSWDFGDQTPGSTEANPSHTFDNQGVYTVVLMVNNDAGSDTAQTTITINAAPTRPVASFTPSTTSGDAPLTVSFDTSASTGEITSYAWDFGDGTTSTESAPSHTYATANTYTVTLTVSGPGGSSDPAMAQITVNEPVVQPTRPFASFTPSTTSGDAPLTVSFDASASTGEITSYAWDFGDGTTSTESAPSHTYAAANTYTVTLTVSGPGGSSDPATAQITVNAASVPPPPINRPLLFVSDRDGNNEIYLLNTDGTVTRLTNDPASDTAPAWSPDGSQVVFVSDRARDNDIFTMNIDGSNVINRTADSPASDTDPAWSPDGSRIAFVSDRDGNNDIFVMNVDGSNLINLTTDSEGSDTAPDWSPDSSQIAFVSNREGNNEVFVVGADGSNPVNLTNDSAASDTDPDWSSDGSQIAFVSNRAGNNDIIAMSANGSNPINLTADSSASETAPDSSPDRMQAVFVSNRDGRNQIYLVSVNDLSNVVNISSSTANDSAPAWRP